MNKKELMEFWNDVIDMAQARGQGLITPGLFLGYDNSIEEWVYDDAGDVDEIITKKYETADDALDHVMNNGRTIKQALINDEFEDVFETGKEMEYANLIDLE